MSYWKSQLKQICDNRSIEDLNNMVKEKRLQIFKYETEARIGAQHRMGYMREQKIRLKETRREIAFILTRMKQKVKAERRRA